MWARDYPVDPNAADIPMNARSFSGRDGTHWFQVLMAAGLPDEGIGRRPMLAAGRIRRERPVTSQASSGALDAVACAPDENGAASEAARLIAELLPTLPKRTVSDLGRLLQRRLTVGRLDGWQP
jgi:hypothetical protein